MPLDPELRPLLDLIAAGVPMHQQTPEAARAAFRMLTVDYRKPEDVLPVAAVEDGTVPGVEGPLPARVYRPDADGPVPTVVLFHGGGFVIGDLDTHDSMARAICRGTTSVVVSVDYRLAPEHRFPAAALDAIAATSAVLAERARYGGSDVVAVAGDSAGGNLSAVAAQTVPGLAAQLLVYPATDVPGEYASRRENASGYFLEMDTMAWFIGHYADDPAAYSDHRLSPMQGPLAGLPPAVVVTAEFDPLRDEGEAYADALAAAGVPVVKRRFDGLIHGFFDMGAFSSACRAAVEESVALFDEVLHRG